MADDTTSTSVPDPVCPVCGLPLRVLRGGLQVGTDGKSIVNVAILGCVNNNYLGSNTPCAQYNVEQSRNETPINTFEE